MIVKGLSPCALEEMAARSLRECKADAMCRVGFECTLFEAVGRFGVGFACGMTR
jgi:hypothetical protein